MLSSWQTTRANSHYHFDPTRIDPRWDTVISVGHVLADWTACTQDILDQSQPATWATRGYAGRDCEPPNEELAAEHADLDRIGMSRDFAVTDLAWDLPPMLERIVDLFRLDDVMARVHVQKPGQLWNLHIDKLQKWCPTQPDRVKRFMIQLTDWQPGHFWSYGNYVYQGWRAGDVTTFDWQHVPHATANAGHSARITLQLTGISNSHTDLFVEQLRYQTFNLKELNWQNAS